MVPVRHTHTKASACGSVLSACVLSPDRVEQAIVTALYAWLVYRAAQPVGDAVGIANVLPLLSEGVVVLFVLLRRRSALISKSLGEWMLALASTCMPLMVIPANTPSVIPVWLAFGVWMTGMVVQLHAKIALGRSFGLVPAHRGLIVTGPYRLVRHPMYAGYLLTHLAFLTLCPSAWNLAVYAICYCLQIPRLFAEERLLRQDASYVKYASTVKYRLLPGIF